jgi:broad specificity phosphatase PhoE
MRAARALLWLLWLAACAPLYAADLGDEGLLRALRSGGYTIYFRHAQTDWSQFDDVRSDADILLCDGERIRQLSGEGRSTAQRIGRAFRDLGIPVSKVLASPYCRTRETAELMDVGPVQTTHDVMNMRVAERFGGRASVIRSARALLARAVARGGNVVVVAHGNVARDATPVYPDEAEGVVFEADGDGGFTVVARIPVQRWRRLEALRALPGS